MMQEAIADLSVDKEQVIERTTQESRGERNDDDSEIPAIDGRRFPIRGAFDV